MEVKCNKCNAIILNKNINVQQDTAYCSQCESLCVLSSLKVADFQFTKNDTVKGVLLDESHDAWTIEASHRSFMALFFIPFTCVWAGGSLWGIYGTQWMSGNWEIQQSLFGLPFLIGSLGLIGVSLMSLFGRTVIANEQGKGLVYIGLGSIGWYRRFDWSDVSSVVEKHNRRYRLISLEGRQRLSFGWGLSAKKQDYIVNAIRYKLVPVIA